MSGSNSDPKDFAKVAAEMVVATKSATMRLLEGEMQALLHMIPGAEPVEAQPLPTDEEVEDGFENMPV